MGTMGILHQDERLAEIVFQLKMTGIEVFTSIEDCMVFKSPLASVQYWPDDETAIVFVDDIIVDTVTHVQAFSDALSLLHMAERENYMVSIKEASRYTLVKVYQKIKKSNMGDYADYLTTPDGEVFANIGLRPVPVDAGLCWQDELHMAVRNKLIYIHPEFTGVEHTFACGQIIIKKVADDDMEEVFFGNQFDCGFANAVAN